MLLIQLPAILSFIRNLRFVSVIIFLTGCSNSKIIQTTVPSEPGIQRVLKAGETHQYQLHLKQGEYIHVKADQFDMDVIAKIYAADSSIIQIFDSPTGEFGAEHIHLISPESKKYIIEIFPAQKYADPGTYAIRLVQKHNATEKDKRWMDALQITQNADSLRSQATSRLQSIQQYEKAMNAWLELKDTTQFANAKRSLGFVFIRLREYEKAVAVFTDLLPIWKQLGDIRAEGFTHLIIGRIYDLQKDYQKSLEYNLNSLPFWEQANDKDQSSFTLMNIGNLYSYLDNPEKTIEYFQQALQKNITTTRPSIKAVILRDYANSLLRLGNNEKAIDYYKQSLAQWQLTANALEEARTAIILGEYFSKDKKNAEAITYFQHALNSWQKINNEEEIKKIKLVLLQLEN